MRDLCAGTSLSTFFCVLCVITPSPLSSPSVFSPRSIHFNFFLSHRSHSVGAVASTSPTPFCATSGRIGMASRRKMQ